MTQANPILQVRDLVLAYILVAVTYVYMGVIVYVSFGLRKDCLEDVSTVIPYLRDLYIDRKSVV